MVFITTEWQFYALRFLIGAMEAGFAPGILYYLTLWFPASFRGRVTSFMFVASAFSGIFGAPVAGLILVASRGSRALRAGNGCSWRAVPAPASSSAPHRVPAPRRPDRGCPLAERAEKDLLSSKSPSQQGYRRPSRCSAPSSSPASCSSPGLLPAPDRFLRPKLLGSGPDQDRDRRSAASVGFPDRRALYLRRDQHGRDREAVRCLGERPKFVAGLAVAAALGFFAAGMFDKQSCR